MFQYQLVIEDGMISTNELEFRAAPCHCTPNKTTCNENSNCAKYLIEPVLPDYHWQKKFL